MSRLPRLPILATAALLALGWGGSARAALVPGDSLRTLQFGGIERNYLLHVPASYDGGAAVPLVLDIHGLGSNAAQQRGLSGLMAVSDREGFLLVHPNGVDHAWNAGLCCGNLDVDDVGFLRALVAEVSAAGNVDASRVYATGLSNGGAMTQRLACDASDLFAAAAPLAFPVPFRPLSECHPVRPMPVLTFMGTNDHLVKYDGGLFPSAPQTIAYWRDLDGCDPAAFERVETSGQSRCEYQTDCNAGVEAGLCGIYSTVGVGTVAEGHILYLNDDFDLAELIWAFLSRFTLPASVPAASAATLEGTDRLKVPGLPADVEDAHWDVGFGSETWWASADGVPLAGSMRARRRRATLALSEDAQANLLAALAARHGSGAPGAVALKASPTLRAKRAKRSGTVRIAGTLRLRLVSLPVRGTNGTYRVKLSQPRD